jgi:hypothetical protein
MPFPSLQAVRSNMGRTGCGVCALVLREQIATAAIFQDKFEPLLRLLSAAVPHHRAFASTTVIVGQHLLPDIPPH